MPLFSPCNKAPSKHCFSIHATAHVVLWWSCKKSKFELMLNVIREDTSVREGSLDADEKYSKVHFSHCNVYWKLKSTTMMHRGSSYLLEQELPCLSIGWDSSHCSFQLNTTVNFCDGCNWLHDTGHSPTWVTEEDFHLICSLLINKTSYT